MSPKVVRFAVAIASLVCAAFGRAETISFPKENPAFTIELPKDAQPKIESDALRVVLFRFGEVRILALPSRVHDDDSARAELGAQLSRYMGNFYVALEKPEPPDVPEKSETFGRGLKGFRVMSVVGGTGEEGSSTSYLASVFTLDGKRYFLFWSTYDGSIDAKLKKSHREEFEEQKNRILNSIAPVK
jgi:hypothetical protein